MYRVKVSLTNSRAQWQLLDNKPVEASQDTNCVITISNERYQVILKLPKPLSAKRPLSKYIEFNFPALKQNVKVSYHERNKIEKL